MFCMRVCVHAQVKATVRTPKGEISLVVNIFALGDALHFVEIHRGKGDLLEYNRIYTSIRSAISDLIQKPSSHALTA